MNQEELLRQVAFGDREAFHQLYLETNRSVYSFILSILKNPQDAEEVLQEDLSENLDFCRKLQAAGKTSCLDVYHCQEPVLYEVSGSETHGRRGTG